MGQIMPIRTHFKFGLEANFNQEGRGKKPLVAKRALKPSSHYSGIQNAFAQRENIGFRFEKESFMITQLTAFP